MIYDTDHVLTLTFCDHLYLLLGGTIVRGPWVATRGRIRLKSEETMRRERMLYHALKRNPYSDLLKSHSFPPDAGH